MKKILLLLFFVTSLACAKTHTLTVLLDWYVNPDHAPLLVAQQQGFFKEEGLSVKFVTPSNPEDGPKFVAANRANIALTYQPSLMLQVDQGLPVTRVGTLINQPLNALVTLKQQGINRISDLKGRKIGYSVNAVSRAMLGTMLATDGLTLKDVNLINVHYALTQGLLTRKIDAAVDMMRNVEVVEIEQLGYPVHVFYPERYGFPMYDELIFIANRDHLNQQEIQKFLHAVQKGVLYLKAHPVASWEESIKCYPELNNALMKKVWFNTIKYFDLRPAYLNKKRYQRLAEYMYQHHLIYKRFALPSYTNS